MHQPTDKLPVTLEAQQWQAVIDLLQAVQAPYKLTAPLIQTMVEQLQPQPRPDNVVPMGESA